MRFISMEIYRRNALIVFGIAFFVSGTDMRTSKMHRLKEVLIMKSISLSGVISEFLER